ncbi:MAG: tetratricopeptide repeat protein [Gammaproteobacteria bacterium]|nr:tetratricopeptide repeat protein [Gammaproteobacteria bacterium]
MKRPTAPKLLVRAPVAVLIVALSIVLVGCGSAEDRKLEHISRGEQYLAEDNLDKARVEFKNALKIDPKDATARYGLAQVLERKRDMNGAMGNYLAAMQESAQHVPSRVKVAQIYVSAANANRSAEEKQALLDKAGTAIDEAYAVAPDDVDVLVTRAMLSMARDDAERARDDVDKVLAMQPAHPQALSMKALMLISQGRKDEALSLLEQGVRTSPNDTVLQRLLASLYARDRKYEEAAGIYSTMVQAAPTNLRDRLGLVALLLRDQKQDEAERVLRAGMDAITEGDDAVSVRLALVGFERRYGAEGDAEKTLVGFVDAAPDEMKYRFALAQLYAANGQNDKARETLQSVVDKQGIEPDGLKARLGMARLAASEKNLDEARRLLGEVLANSANDLGALELRARIALAEKQYPDAIRDLRSVVRNKPNDADLLSLLGQAHLANKDRELAVDAWQRAIEAEPDNKRPRMLLAQLFVNEGKLDDAESLLSAALENQPTDVNTLQAITRIQLSKGDLEAAGESARKLQEEHPDQALGYYLAGEVSRARKDFAGAAAQFDQALTLAPDAALPLAGVVSTKLAMGEDEQVLQTLDAFLAKSPDNQQALLMRARVLMRERRFADAEAVFERLVELTPESGAAYRGVALSQYAQGNIEAAVASYRRGLEAARVKEPLLVDLGLVFERQERIDEAVDLYESYLKANPDSQVAANNLAMLYVTHRDDGKSLKKAKELADKLKASDNPGFLDTVGWVYHKAGDVDAAIAALEKAIAAAPQMVPEFHYHLGVAYAARGDTAKAKEHLGKAVDAKQAFRGLEDARARLEKLGS